MKTLTNLTLALSIILFFTLTSCINDSEVITEETLENTSTESTITEQAEAKTEEVKEIEVVEEKVIEKEVEESVIKAQPKDIEKKEILKVKKEVKIVEKKEEVKLSESIDLTTDRNQSYNPDNANAPVELEDDNSIELKPIFSDSDMGKYYVVFKESHAKINRKDISKLVKTGQKVYVANHQGIYKYCVGQSENENDAKAYKIKFDKEQGNNSSTVSTFSSAW